MNDMIASSAYFGVVISLIAYWIGLVCKKRFKKAVFNPILIAVTLVIFVLLLFKIDYQAYYSSAKYLSYLLTPTTVCLSIPLYEQIHMLRKNALAIILGISAGVFASLGCILLMSLLMNMSTAETMTLLPKSITTAIGVPLVDSLGGYSAIAAIVIILTGIVGNLFAESLLKLFRIVHPVARGIGIGTASHAIGTSKAIELGEVEGAMSGLSIAVSGLITVIVISVITMI